MRTEKSLNEKTLTITMIIVAVFVVMLLRLWQLQIIHGFELRKTSESNKLRIIDVPAPRGIIYDRNGIPLVKDTPFFIASVIPEEFNKDDTSRLSEILDLSDKEILKMLTNNTQEESSPVRLKERLSFEEISFIEARRSDIPGLIIEVDSGRKYVYGETGAHLIGYLGKITPAQSDNPDFKDVPSQAFIGQWGMEKLYDTLLRGIAGKKFFEVDALGREISLFKEQLPEKGDDLSLSIDIALQREAEKAFKGKTGALVALKPDTGEILGMVSRPSFNPNKFSRGISEEEWKAITKDKKFPMLNRSIQSQFPPGSTFKLITAIAALEEGVIDENTTVNCRGSIKYGKRRFRCWKKYGHGRVSIHRAIVESCDVFFYETGKRLGIDKIYEYATRFGLNKLTGFPLGNEKKGLIPNTEWKMQTKKTKWFLGETFINAIGQGYVSATPIQMAAMMSTIANGGIHYRPLILKQSEPIPADIVNLKPDTIRIINESLKGVVNEPRGTGKAARSNEVTIGGKTGTAQVVGIRKDSKDLPEKFRDHAWFVAYAPVEEPEIALSVFVEHGGHGGSAAAPIAKKAIEAYLLPLGHKKEMLNVQD